MPLVVYLMIRAGLTAIWYIPLSKIEHIKDAPDFKDLANKLEAYANEAQERAKYVQPTERLKVPEMQALVDRVRKFGDDIEEQEQEYSRSDDGIRDMVRDDPSDTDLKRRKLVEKIGPDIHKTYRETLTTGQRCLHEIRVIEEQVQQISDQLKDLDNFRNAAREFSDLVQKNIGSQNLRAVVTSFRALNGDIGVASSRKVRIEFWFGLVLPMLWASYSVWLGVTFFWL